VHMMMDLAYFHDVHDISIVVFTPSFMWFILYCLFLFLSNFDISGNG
jgi:hypothetical protein